MMFHRMILQESRTISILPAKRELVLLAMIQKEEISLGWRMGAVKIAWRRSVRVKSLAYAKCLRTREGRLFHHKAANSVDAAGAIPLISEKTRGMTLRDSFTEMGRLSRRDRECLTAMTKIFSWTTSLMIGSSERRTFSNWSRRSMTHTYLALASPWDSHLTF